MGKNDESTETFEQMNAREKAAMERKQSELERFIQFMDTEAASVDKILQDAFQETAESLSTLCGFCRMMRNMEPADEFNLDDLHSLVGVFEQLCERLSAKLDGMLPRRYATFF